MLTKMNIILFLQFSLAFNISAQTQFIDSNIPIIGVWDGSAEWGDYDDLGAEEYAQIKPLSSKKHFR